MTELTWDDFAATPVEARGAALMASSAVRQAIEESIQSVHKVLSADGVDTTHVLDLRNTAELLGIALAPAWVWVLDSQDSTLVKRRTSESTWMHLAHSHTPCSTFSSMWDRTLDMSRERRQLGELTWLDEFVLEGSCRGWTTRPPDGSESHLPSATTVCVPTVNPPRKIRGWLVARYDRYVQNILCDSYSQRPWWRQFGGPSEASLDFWGFYASLRWDVGGLERARYLGQAALSTYLFLQARAWAKEHERQRPSAQGIPGEGEFGGGRASPYETSSTSAFLNAARDCIERHKSSFGAEVQAWVELNLALCHSSYTDFANAMKLIPDSLRSTRSLSYKTLHLFREAVIACVEGSPGQRATAPSAISQRLRSAREEGAPR
ncbi:MAG: hypothetical protein AAFO89_04945 [Planctomycetota bacterium]